MEEGQEKTEKEEILYKRKPKENIKNHMKWVGEIDYKGHEVTVMELEIEKDNEKWKEFQWITNLKIMGKTAREFAQTGRRRWQIENEGFNI